MFIECTLKRDGGTKVDIGNSTYHFVQKDDGCHVCEVTNEDHAARFLRISEAYRPYKTKDIPASIVAKMVAKAAPVVEVQAPVEQTESTLDDLSDDDLRDRFHERFDCFPDGDATRDDIIDAIEEGDASLALPEDDGTPESGDALPATAGDGESGDGVDYESMNDDQLRAELKQRTGRNPHGAMTRANMIAKLQELDA